MNDSILHLEKPNTFFDFLLVIALCKRINRYFWVCRAILDCYSNEKSIQIFLVLFCLCWWCRSYSMCIGMFLLVKEQDVIRLSLQDRVLVYYLLYSELHVCFVRCVLLPIMRIFYFMVQFYHFLQGL